MLEIRGFCSTLRFIKRKEKERVRIKSHEGKDTNPFVCVFSFNFTASSNLYLHGKWLYSQFTTIRFCNNPEWPQLLAAGHSGALISHHVPKGTAASPQRQNMTRTRQKYQSDNGKRNRNKERAAQICKKSYTRGKKMSSLVTSRNKVELLMLEGGCVESSRWKKQKEMWKITYYAQFRKWLDLFTLLSLSHFIFLRNVTAVKYCFPLEFTHFVNQQITVPAHTFHSHAAQPVCSFSRSSCSFALVRVLISFCADGLMGMGVYQLSNGTSVSAGLYTCASSSFVW